MPEPGERDDGSLDETVHATGSGERDAAVPPALALTEASASGVATHSPSADLSIARGATIGRYLVLDRLGSGTMGVVLAAFDQTLDRKVALKVVRPELTGSTLGRQRLIREAQAMARLSHRNVVTVFEVGSVDDHVFLAMEYVAGSTLGEWCAAPGRTRREVLAAYVAAGHGLAAAHKAGIVHRDFKPGNVLVSADGEIRVADFGLATGGDAETGPIGAGITLGNLAMTATGALLGTPAYMAPEQHRGEPADARADQFAFGVALYEALYGKLPFEGTDYPTYAGNVLAGRVRDTPRRGDVSARVRRVILRGLATDPAQRYPSMSALLGELDRVAVRRRATLLAGGGVVAAAAIAALVLARGDGDPCAAATPTFAGIWDGELRTGIARAFAKVGERGADLAGKVTAVFDQRTGEISAMRRDACRATHVRRDQSADLLDRRTQCLDARTTEVATLAKLFAGTTDAAVIDRSTTAVRLLTPVAACADREALLAAVPPPSEPARRARLAALDAKVAAGQTFNLAGKYPEASALADEVLAVAAEVAYPAVEARARGVRSTALYHLEHHADAEAEARKSAALAAIAKDDYQLAKAWIQVYSVLAADPGRAAEAATVDPLIEGFIVRAGDSGELRGLLNACRGMTAMTARRDAEAVGFFQTAERDYVSAFGANDPRVVNMLNNAGIALHSAGQLGDARTSYDRALAIQRGLIGEQHPNIAISLASIGAVLDELGDLEAALDHFKRAAAIEDAVLPPEHPRRASTHSSIGVVLDRLGRHEEALVEHRAAVAALETSPNRQGRLENALLNLGSSLFQLGRKAESLAVLERSLALVEREAGPDHPDVAGHLVRLWAPVREIDPARAGALLERALAIHRKRGIDHPETARVLATIASEAIYTGDDRRALPLIDEAIAILDRLDARTTDLYLPLYLERGRVRLRLRRPAEAVADLTAAREMALARDNRQLAAMSGAELADALWALGTAKARGEARDAATAALALYEADGETEAATAVRAWLTAHPGK